MLKSKVPSLFKYPLPSGFLCSISPEPPSSPPGSAPFLRLSLRSALGPISSCLLLVLSHHLLNFSSPIFPFLFLSWGISLEGTDQYSTTDNLRTVLIHTTSPANHLYLPLSTRRETSSIHLCPSNPDSPPPTVLTDMPRSQQPCNFQTQFPMHACLAPLPCCKRRLSEHIVKSLPFTMVRCMFHIFYH